MRGGFDHEAPSKNLNSFSIEKWTHENVPTQDLFMEISCTFHPIFPLVKATFVATISIWPVTPKADDYELSTNIRVVLELLTRIRVVLETNMWTRSLSQFGDWITLTKV